MTHDAESVVTEAIRDLVRWLYRQREREYDDQMSDASVDEAIAANAYTLAWQVGGSADHQKRSTSRSGAFFHVRP
jgi:hypothetical protein